jgi:UDP-GlcNAc3NAcA epimerase
VRIVTIVGARPQFVKAAVVSPALAAAGIDERIIDTGQHYDPEMSTVFFDELQVPAPSWSLEVGSGSHGAQTATMLERIEVVLQDNDPDVVMVYGDTNSTLAGALAAAKLHIPIAHVEAGLRSFNRRMPEEVNRVVTDHVSSLLLAPTETAVANLASEGIAGDSVQLVGDVMYDLALRAAGAADRSLILDRVGVERGAFLLATIHRAENTDDSTRFDAIVGGLAEASLHQPVVWPVHPRTRVLLAGRDLPDSVHLIDPVGYLDMVRLERTCAAVVTDSGGVQKEAFFHGKQCVTVRDETEWVELVELGWNRLTPPTSSAVLVESINDALMATGRPGEPYGTGKAGESIAAALLSGFTE